MVLDVAKAFLGLGLATRTRHAAHPKRSFAKVQSVIAMPRSKHTCQVSASRTVSGRKQVGNDGTIPLSGRERVGNDRTVLDSGQQRLGRGCEHFVLRPGTADRNGNGFRRDTVPFRDRRRHATRRTKQKIEQVVAPNGPRANQSQPFSNPIAPVGARIVRCQSFRPLRCSVQ